MIFGPVTVQREQQNRKNNRVAPRGAGVEGTRRTCSRRSSFVAVSNSLTGPSRNLVLDPCKQFVNIKEAVINSLVVVVWFIFSK
jgi:hypothetical protein